MDMPTLAMRVAVDHRLCPVGAQRRRDGVGIDIHDLHRLESLFRLAAGAQCFDLAAPLRERPGEETATPRGAAYLRPKTLVVGVVGAERIAMGEQGLDPADVVQAGIGQQRRAGGGGEIAADEEVTVAGHEEQRYALLRESLQGGGDARVERVGKVIVACPVVEEVAKDGQAGRVPSRAGKEVEKQLRRPRFVRGQVQVGDEQRRQTTSAFSITTSSTGTS